MHGDKILNTTYKTSVSLGLVEGYRQFSFFLGILMFLLLVFSLSFAAFTSYLQIRFVLMREHTIGKRLFHGYLNQPYSYFLNRHRKFSKATNVGCIHSHLLLFV